MGAGNFQVTMNNGERCATSTAFLGPDKPSNL